MTTPPIKIKEVIGGGYDKFWNCTARYRVLKGGKASKKSTTTALNFIFRLMKYPGSNLLVVRRVMNTHRDSTFAQLSWAQSRLNVSHLWSNTVSPMEMCFLPTGQKILFRGFDDVLKLAYATVSSGALNFVWIEEAFEIENEADFDKLDLSVPRGRLPDGLFKQTTLTFNPWSASHWLKKRFFDTTAPDCEVFSTNYKCNEFLDSTDLAVFSRMQKTNMRKYEVAGLGNWGISEGLVFNNWETRVLDIPKSELYMWKNFFGLDYGYSNDPTAFIAFKVNPLARQIYVFDEFYKKGMLNCDIAKEIIRRGYSKERIRADCAEPKSNDDLKRLGISRICPSLKGRDSILHGIAEISEYKIFVNPACPNTARELSNYVYETKPSATGQILPADRDNHLCDAMRYAFSDVKFFKPENEARVNPVPYPAGISAGDLRG